MGNTVIDTGRACNALNAINPDTDREQWVRAGMAAKAAGLDFDDFDAWSQGGQSYREADARSTWRSINSNGGIGAGTLFAMAKEHGWQGDMPSPAERDAMNERARRQREQARRQRQRKQEATAEKARCEWANAVEADPQHTYLQTKRVKPYQLRQNGNCLLVPLVDGETLVNLQRIYPDGTKRFLSGGRIRGCYSAIGDADGPLYICEGWATGATIHGLTGHCVACAMNAGNLLSVTQLLRNRHPGRHIIIAGDNDRHTDGNPGKTAALKAARAIGAECIVPDFSDHLPGTDYNDLSVLEAEGRI